MPKKPFVARIEDITVENTAFRKTADTGTHLQLVLMSLAPNEHIGAETHAHVDQFFRIEQGIATAIVDGVIYKLKSDDVLIVHAGSLHNIINRSRTRPLKLYTIYGPPNHTGKCVQKRKQNREC